MNSSRGVTYPQAAHAAKTMNEWRDAVSGAMAAAAAELGAACAL